MSDLDSSEERRINRQPHNRSWWPSLREETLRKTVKRTRISHKGGGREGAIL